ncbi:MAG: hypothetical protein B7W99_00310 [Rhodospirillales bacterium 20-58-10]|nr:MAG: hypothetical protein B7W99_00310 [Rhodospirillales bacterium 20-58-10]
MQKTIFMVGGNLFAVAAMYLQDATQWIRIAQANKLSDPIVSGSMNLVIPDLDMTAGGGVAK